MVRGKKTSGATLTPRRAPRPTTGPLDDFLHPPAPRDTAEACTDSSPKMAEARPSPARSPDPLQAIARLEKMVAALPTQTDLTAMVEDFRVSFQTELREVRTDIGELRTRTSELERRANLPPQLPAPLEEDLADMKRRLDDLDNRGRRHNMRIRGLPETVPMEELRDCVQAILVRLLGDSEVSTVPLDRCHRALRPPPPAGTPPRDVICRVTCYTLKDRLMNIARSRREWDIEGFRLEFYQDLSPLTLAARRALRPVTQLLQRHRIAYRWGFPFSLQVRLDGILTTIRRPKDVPDFLACLTLPPTTVTNWEAGGLLERPARPRAPVQRSPRRNPPHRNDQPRSPPQAV
uniref:Uncharacterized protein n=1 Tax=Leptobrachium leishanense TaxID=445787 RepID=A0A8C5PU82_9ANUR